METPPFFEKRPQPVTVPVRPTKSSSVFGRQIGMALGLKSTGLDIFTRAMSFSTVFWNIYPFHVYTYFWRKKNNVIKIVR